MKKCPYCHKDLPQSGDTIPKHDARSKALAKQTPKKDDAEEIEEKDDREYGKLKK